MVLKEVGGADLEKLLLDPSNFYSDNQNKFESIVNDSAKMAELADSIGGMRYITSIGAAMDKISSSSTARSAIGTSDSDSVGYTEIKKSNSAIGKYAAGHAGLTPSNFADMDVVASDSTAMDSIARDNTAMDAVFSSRVAVSSTVTSDTAMSEIADHGISYIKNNWNKQTLSDGQTITNRIIYTEVEGGAGGAGGGRQYGDSGGSSSLGGAVAKGGGAGTARDYGSRDGGDGGFTGPPSPSQLVEGINGGGGESADDPYTGGGEGGHGGFIAALISNGDRSFLTASVGSGGNRFDSAEDGSVTMWLPPNTT
jgi:hypothetical protein